MPHTFVVTGATSFLGARLAGQLLAEGNKVYAVCRNNGKADTVLGRHERLLVVTASLDDYPTLAPAIGHADVFVHLAWEGTGHQGRNANDIQQANIQHADEAMQLARQLGCQLFVMAGSQAEYGTQLQRIDEQTACQPFSEYGKAKLEVCRRGFAFAEQQGMKYMHLRIFSLYGEGDHEWTLVMSSISRMLRNEPMPLSPCTQQWNFLYVGDAVRQIDLLCLHALERSDFQHEIYNIASDDTRPLRSFVEDIKRLTRSDSELQFGAITPQQTVSLTPDMSKVRDAIHFVSQAPFDDIISKIIHSQQAT